MGWYLSERAVKPRPSGRGGRQDEDKVMLGFDDKDQARDAYLAHFQTQGYLGEVTEMPMFEFKQKIKSNAGNKIA